MQRLTSIPIAPPKCHDASEHIACALCPGCHHGGYAQTHSEMRLQIMATRATAAPEWQQVEDPKVALVGASSGQF